MNALYSFLQSDSIEITLRLTQQLFLFRNLCFRDWEIDVGYKEAVTKEDVFHFKKVSKEKNTDFWHFRQVEETHKFLFF